MLSTEPFLTRTVIMHSNRSTRPTSLYVPIPYRSESKRQRRAKLRAVTRREGLRMKTAEKGIYALSEVTIADVERIRWDDAHRWRNV